MYDKKPYEKMSLKKEKGILSKLTKKGIAKNESEPPKEPKPGPRT